MLPPASSFEEGVCFLCEDGGKIAEALGWGCLLSEDECVSFLNCFKERAWCRSFRRGHGLSKPREDVGVASSRANFSFLHCPAKRGQICFDGLGLVENFNSVYACQGVLVVEL